jgi:S-DNA-T family DNA segregation ATPase FtsK/SpoIIIE
MARVAGRAWRYATTPREPEARFRVRRLPKPSPVSPEEQPAIPPSPVTRGDAEVAGTAAGAAQAAEAQPVEEMWRRLASQTILTPSGWQLPSVDILDKGTETVLSQADNEKRAQLIEDALRSYGVEARVVEINVGPTVTQFGVEPGWDVKYRDVKERDVNGDIRTRRDEVSRTRVKVERIASLANDLALALAAPTIRIEAPVPGKSVVGIEVPNTTMGVVTLRSVVETAAFQRLRARSKLALALGKGAGGEPVVADLAKMPHLLIAGATGSGKTVCLNAIIACLLIHNTPEDVQFIMVDPKRVEMVSFNTIPHLVAPVVVDAEKAVDVLRWLLGEMDRRYNLLARSSARNIEDFNKKSPAEPIPYLVLVIDELADLMMTAYEEVERSLCRLAQLARATGIHLVVATQRPSVDVVTGLIKANFPTRISFAVTSQVDSRTILDFGGAEKLLGKGDMLYMPTDATKPRRLQGCFVSDQEIERMVYLWNSQKGPEPALRVREFTAPSGGTVAGGVGEDPLLSAARRLSQEHRHISASFLQRRLHIGFPRAARLMELLEQERGSGEGRPEEDDAVPSDDEL